MRRGTMFAAAMLVIAATTASASKAQHVQCQRAPAETETTYDVTLTQTELGTSFGVIETEIVYAKGKGGHGGGGITPMCGGHPAGSARVEMNYSDSGWWGYWELTAAYDWSWANERVTATSLGWHNMRAGGSCHVTYGPNSYITANYGTAVDWRTDGGFSCTQGWLNGSPWVKTRLNWAGQASIVDSGV